MLLWEDAGAVWLILFVYFQSTFCSISPALTFLYLLPTHDDSQRFLPSKAPNRPSVFVSHMLWIHSESTTTLHVNIMFPPSSCSPAIRSARLNKASGAETNHKDGDIRERALQDSLPKVSQIENRPKSRENVLISH